MENVDFNLNDLMCNDITNKQSSSASDDTNNIINNLCTEQMAYSARNCAWTPPAK